MIDKTPKTSVPEYEKYKEEHAKCKPLLFDEVFVSVQGEGKYTGIPSIFLRTSGCNLRCVFAGGSICDTDYTSFCPNRGRYNTNYAKKFIASHPQVNHIVITGGEPLLWKKQLEQFLSEIYEDRMVITIETNGTMPMLNPLAPFRIKLYSVSPKLSTSMATPGQVVHTSKGDKTFNAAEIERLNKIRINIPNLVSLAGHTHDYQFKFVYSNPDSIKEIEQIYAQMDAEAKSQGEPFYQLYLKNRPELHTQLMPEGRDIESLTARMKECVGVCIEKNWRICDRLHIRIFGDTKCT